MDIIILIFILGLLGFLIFIIMYSWYDTDCEKQKAFLIGMLNHHDPVFREKCRVSYDKLLERDKRLGRK